MKYLAISVLFMFNNELLSLLTLLIMVVLFIADILKARIQG